ncbi:imidazoleglycerol-phosphate dehydratase HisB [Suttonella ornithocola]|uniref:Imidazoleglycerol-phosphate dehydratase n=1 Tax=Suttonella ornithocola TaxID=279832 RepID=A0A380MMH3_9GAMM|nr:imidazoleglycerol-phosphate dehydratase HisB [Suttonella ornithocola]SUO93829.1 Histidine biosynthesis bifunctional protein hisB [Suttonella ornithocola]
MTRTATLNRNTSETQIQIDLNLDGTGKANLQTGIGFFDHMLDQIARHGCFDLSIQVQGDLHIDCHHSVEDTGIALGDAMREALGDKRGITRYGHAYVPLDEALSRVVIDFSGRPGLYWHVNFSRDKIGEIDTETFYEFFNGFANHARATIHIDNIRGINNHHIIETIFKAFGRALRMAAMPDPRAQGQIPSTKGLL